MRYRLRTLLIVLALGPMVLALPWLAWEFYRDYRAKRVIDEFISVPVLPDKEPAIYGQSQIAMFRFSTRDLLWLMVVVGLALGWAADRERLTGRYWPREQRISAAQSEFAKNNYPPAFFREIHIMDNWSMNKGELGRTVIEEWKRGYVRIVTEMKSEVEGEDEYGKYVDTRYVSTIHRNRTGEILEHPWSHRGRFSSLRMTLQPPTAAPSSATTPPPSK